MHLVMIAILLAVFFFWTSMLARVHKEFKLARNMHVPMTLTFYTLGIAGVLLLLGRRGKDPMLAEWVERITGEAPEETRPAAVGVHLGDVDLEDDRERKPVRPDLERGVSEGGLATSKMILQEAIRERATDVHLEPGPGQLRVRYRVDGVLQTRGVYPAEMAATVTSALKVQGNMDVAERRRPQEGSFSATFADRPVDFRVSSMGTPYGEKLVIRVLDKRLGLRTLQALGFRQSMYHELHSIVTKQNGMLVVCGPTGSGKTTTLYAALQEVDRQSLNVITIENPIEYRIENITQHDVNEVAGITFASLLKTTLHQDPDILMVGEMRDKETAEIAIQAATTGHFVYTTAHAPDTVSALFRLHSLGVQPYAVASALTAILAQRLMRRLCRACRVAHEPTTEETKKLSLKKGSVLYTAKGCDACLGTGWKGRIAVFELLVLDDEIKSLLQAGASLAELRKAARKAGLVPLQVDALAKAIAGITSVQEALRATT